MAWAKDVSDFYVEDAEEQSLACLWAQLFLMDIPSEPTTRDGVLYIFLYTPAFESSSCIVFEDTSTISCTLTILLDNIVDVYDAIRNANAYRLSQSGLFDKRVCWRQTAVLSAEQQEDFREKVLREITPPPKTSADMEQERDGMVVKYIVISAGQTHVIEIGTKTPLCRFAIALAKPHFSRCSLLPEKMTKNYEAYIRRVVTVGAYLERVLKYTAT
jgi:hypothetical protein